MKREMKSKSLNLVLLLLFVVIFSGCSFFQKKEKEIAKPEEVINAIIIDDHYLLNKYLSEGFPIEYETESGKTLLELVLENNSLNSLDILIVRGVDTNKKDSRGQTPVFKVRSLEALKKLIEDKIDINIVDNNQETLLTYFIKNKPITYSKYLVNLKPKFNIPEVDGWDSTYWATINGDSELIKEMAENGAYFWRTDSKGNYPIYYAYNEQNILALLDITGFDIYRKNLAKENIFGEIYLRAVANAYYLVIDKLISLGIDTKYMSYGDSAFSIAEDNKNVQMLDFLRNRGIR